VGLCTIILIQFTQHTQAFLIQSSDRFQLYPENCWLKAIECFKAEKIAETTNFEDLPMKGSIYKAIPALLVAQLLQALVTQAERRFLYLQSWQVKLV